VGQLSLISPSLKGLEQQQFIEWQNIHSSLQQLIVTESKMERILSNTKLLLDKYLKIK
jgi:hypothetical protein